MHHKKVINPHKIKRGLSRIFKRDRGNVVSRFEQFSRRNRKDFSSRDEESPIHEKRAFYARLRRRFEIILLLVSLISMMWLLLFHAFFQINQVHVQGLRRIDDVEFLQAVEGILDYKKLYFLPGNSFFLADIDEIRDIVLTRFPVQSIVLQKKFPHSLSIIVEEKLSTVIYDNSEYYSYVGIDGKIVELLRQVGESEWKETRRTVVTTTPAIVSTSSLALASVSSTTTFVTKTIEIVSRVHKPQLRHITTELGDYPVVYDLRHNQVKVNTQVLPQESVEGIIKWYTMINTYTDVPFSYITLDNDMGVATILTREGWQIKVQLHQDIDTQFNQLKIVLAEHVDRATVQYIDLRYINRIYWR